MSNLRIIAIRNKKRTTLIPLFNPPEAKIPILPVFSDVYNGLTSAGGKYNDVLDGLTSSGGAYNDIINGGFAGTAEP